MNTKHPAPVIMAERRAVVWARLEAHRAAMAERRARRWARLSVALWILSGASFLACVVAATLWPATYAPAYGLASMILSGVAAADADARRWK